MLVKIVIYKINFRKWLVLKLTFNQTPSFMLKLENLLVDSVNIKQIMVGDLNFSFQSKEGIYREVQN